MSTANEKGIPARDIWPGLHRLALILFWLVVLLVVTGTVSGWIRIPQPGAGAVNPPAASLHKWTAHIGLVAVLIAASLAVIWAFLVQWHRSKLKVIGTLFVCGLTVLLWLLLSFTGYLNPEQPPGQMRGSATFLRFMVLHGVVLPFTLLLDLVVWGLLLRKPRF